MFFQSLPFLHKYFIFLVYFWRIVYFFVFILCFIVCIYVHLTSFVTAFFLPPAIQVAFHSYSFGLVLGIVVHICCACYAPHFSFSALFQTPCLDPITPPLHAASSSTGPIGLHSCLIFFTNVLLQLFFSFYHFYYHSLLCFYTIIVKVSSIADRLEVAQKARGYSY